MPAREEKDYPIEEEVHLIKANPKYAHIQFSNGRQDTVSIQDLSPVKNPSSETINVYTNKTSVYNSTQSHLKDELTPPSTAAEQSTTSAAQDLFTGSPTIMPTSLGRI
ncbi:hypothetical protein SK128_012025, partial [Halocaridina rubra]